MSENIKNEYPVQFSSDGSFFETFQKIAQGRTEQVYETKSSNEEVSTTGAPPKEEQSWGDFVESSSFSGRRPGFIFKNGESGLGEVQRIPFIF
jgi:hypothetical protein